MNLGHRNLHKNPNLNTISDSNASSHTATPLSLLSYLKGKEKEKQTNTIFNGTIFSNIVRHFLNESTLTLLKKKKFKCMALIVFAMFSFSYFRFYKKNNYLENADLVIDQSDPFMKVNIKYMNRLEKNSITLTNPIDKFKNGVVQTSNTSQITSGENNFQMDLNLLRNHLTFLDGKVDEQSKIIENMKKDITLYNNVALKHRGLQSDFDDSTHISKLPSFTTDDMFYVTGAVLTRDRNERVLEYYQSKIMSNLNIIIEGKDKTYNEKTLSIQFSNYYVDTFFMGKKIYFGRGPHHDVSNVEYSSRWRKAIATTNKDPAEYLIEKELSQRAYYTCHFTRHTADFNSRLHLPDASKYEYEVEGVFIPSETTLDPNVNDAVQILRCPIPAKYVNEVAEDLTVSIYMKRNLFMETTGYSAKEETRLITYRLPWYSRSIGLVEYQPYSNFLDPWKGKKDDANEDYALLNMDFMHLCVPGLRSKFTCPRADTLMEFLEYHFQQGVEHIYLGVHYSWDSDDMMKLLSLAKDYIQKGKVSISSTAVFDSYVDEEDVDKLGKDNKKSSESTKVTFGSEMIKLYHMNQCLFYAKGLAKYVGIWDIDELLIPMNSTETLPEAVNRLLDKEYNKHILKIDTEILQKKEKRTSLVKDELNVNKNIEKETKKATDNESSYPRKKKKEDKVTELSTEIQVLEKERDQFDIHQYFCFMKFLSYSHIAPESNDLMHYMGNRRDHLWNGQVFYNRREELSDDTWKKAILSTKHIYFTGYHLPGACLSKGRNWDKVVDYGDAIHVEDTDLAMFHFRNKLSTSGIMKTDVNVTSEYVQNGFFQKVLRGLKNKGIERKVFELCKI